MFLKKHLHLSQTLHIKNKFKTRHTATNADISKTTIKDRPYPTRNSIRKWEPVTPGEDVELPFWTDTRAWVFILLQVLEPNTHLHSNKIILPSLMSHMGKISTLKVYMFLLFPCQLSNTAVPQGSLSMPSSPHAFSLISSAFTVLTNTPGPQILTYESLSVFLSFNLLYLPACWTDFKLRRSELNSSSPPRLLAKPAVVDLELS